MGTVGPERNSSLSGHKSYTAIASSGVLMRWLRGQQSPLFTDRVVIIIVDAGQGAISPMRSTSKNVPNDMANGRRLAYGSGRESNHFPWPTPRLQKHQVSVYIEILLERSAPLLASAYERRHLAIPDLFKHSDSSQSSPLDQTPAMHASHLDVDHL